MGSELRRMIRDGAPASWTPLMRLVAMEIADDARDPDRSGGASAVPPWSAIPVQGGWDRHGRRRDGLTERTGMSARAISRVLTDLAKAGYEMREVLGTRKDGRAAVTAPGRAMRFRVPRLPPRPIPERSPDPAAVEQANDRRIWPSSTPNDRQIWQQRSPDLAATIAEFGDPIPSGSPHYPLTAEALSRSPADVEGARRHLGEASPDQRSVPDLRTQAGTERARMTAADALTEWQREHEPGQTGDHSSDALSHKAAS